MKSKIIIVLVIIFIVYSIVKNKFIEKFIDTSYELINEDHCPDYIAYKKLNNNKTLYYMFFKNKHLQKGINPLVFDSRFLLEEKLKEFNCYNKKKKINS